MHFNKFSDMPETDIAKDKISVKQKLDNLGLKIKPATNI